jgi:YggT family protein
MDGFAVAFITFIIDLFIILFFVRIFIAESERFDPIFGLIVQATNQVIIPLRTALPWRQAAPACLVVIAALLVLKGLVVRSIPGTLQAFVSTLFQLYVFIMVIIAAYREYYTNPITTFGQRMVNPIRAVVAHMSQHLLTVNLLSIVLLIVLHTVLTVLLSGRGVKEALVLSLVLVIGLTTYFIFAIIINALLSWVSPDPLNPIVQFLALISAPIVEPVRRVIPPLAGAIDLSPMIAIFALMIGRDIALRLLASF